MEASAKSNTHKNTSMKSLEYFTLLKEIFKFNYTYNNINISSMLHLKKPNSLYLGS
jgi:hypothetical protein